MRKSDSRVCATRVVGVDATTAIELIRFVPEARLGSLDLQPAPDPRGARLRIVA